MSHRSMPLEKLALDFGEGVMAMSHNHDLPRELFAEPDHLAVSVPGAWNFGRYVIDQVLPYSREAAAIEAGDELVVSALLRKPLDLHDVGLVDRVKVTQRDHDHSGVAVEYAAFWVDDSQVTEAVIRAISYDIKTFYCSTPPYLLVKDRNRPDMRLRFVEQPHRRYVDLELSKGGAVLIDLQSEAPNTDPLRNA